MISNRTQWLKGSRLKHLGFALIIAVAGMLLIWWAMAATLTANIQPESGQRSSQVSTVSSADASGGAYVKFGPGVSQPAWKPLATKPGGWAWQWQLDTPVNETVLDGSSNPNKMYDIDMFSATPAVISRLKAKGIYVVCYIESGDFSPTRPDAGDFNRAADGSGMISSNKLQGFNEWYINGSRLDSVTGPTGKTLRQIMTARLQLAKDKGCEGIEPDLDDLHTYPTKPWKMTQAQQVAYNKFWIDTGHALGMSVGLKNGPDGTGANSFTTQMFNAGADWVLSEECNQYDECDGYNIFVQGGRAVFQVEYQDNQGVPYNGTNGTCARNNAAGFDGIVKDSSSSLAALPRIPCRSGN